MVRLLDMGINILALGFVLLVAFAALVGGLVALGILPQGYLGFWTVIY